jgi:hypothetical protein
MNILLYHHSPFPPGILPESIQILTNYIIHKKCPIANRIKKKFPCPAYGNPGNTYLLWKPGFYGIL